MSIRCRLGVHQWAKWGEMVPAYGGLTQFRSCNFCNKIQYTKCYGNQADPKEINRTTGQDKLEQEQIKK